MNRKATLSLHPHLMQHDLMPKPTHTATSHFWIRQTRPSRLSRWLSLFLSVFSVLCLHTLQAAVFLDNTSGQTGVAGGGSKSVDGNDWFGYSFQTPTTFPDTNYGDGRNYFYTLSGLFSTTADSGNYTVDVKLYTATLSLSLIHI